MSTFAVSAGQLAKVKAFAVINAQKVGLLVAADARARAPVRTGRFRDSITVSRSATGAVVRASDPAGAFIEFGTVDTPAFMSLHSAARKYGRLTRG